MKQNFDQFFTDDFFILSYLYDLKQDGEKVAITQSEIAKHFSLSRATVNTIIGRLKKSEFIEIDGLHVGRYIFKERGLKFIKQFRKALKAMEV